MQHQLEPGEAAIEFVKYKYYTGKRWTDSIYYLALLLKNEGDEPEMIRLFEERALDNLVHRDNSRKNIDSIYGHSEKGATAYNHIWAPLEYHLQGIKKIYFAPAGLLYRVSFGALVMNDQELLSDKYQLVQLNSTASIANNLTNYIDTGDNVQLYGGIQYEADSSVFKKAMLAYNFMNVTRQLLPDDLERANTWQYLPGTETEISTIENIGIRKKYIVSASKGIAASEESTKSKTGKASPGVIHIATHGFFFPDPKDGIKEQLSLSGSGNVFRQSDNPLFRSGLLMAGANLAWKGKPIEGMDDGILTAYEVSDLYLPRTKLVVLSACETGLGDIQGNEGVYGLQRAFKIAGAQNLVMSLWKVPDESTAEFMKEFYQNIFQHQSIDDAFYHAQTAMKNKYRNEPYKWAAWVLVR